MPCLPPADNTSINNAGYATQRKPMTPLDLTTVEGAIDYHRTWSVNAYGPLLFSTTLLDMSLLVSPDAGTASPTSITLEPPIICNISSGQASLTWANEMWTGGSPRDELYFHPVYASSKAALSGITMHMARILRVSWIQGSTLASAYIGRTRSWWGRYTPGGSRPRWAAPMRI
jgi:NAD(P)-dependent dehydrogenase (short-subunit alcohol dehydrogenase family)